MTTQYSTGMLATQFHRRTASRSVFFAAMSGVSLFIVLSGFTPTLYFRPLFSPPAIPGYLFLHGIVLTSWFTWLCVQTLLIRSGRTALHRRLGVAGAVLAAAVPFAGLLATAGVVGRVVAIGIDLNADASVLVGIGVSGVPVVQFLSSVVWSNLSSAVSFAVLAWTGLLLRRRPAAHKRLMLLATIAILGPALARLAAPAILRRRRGTLRAHRDVRIARGRDRSRCCDDEEIHPATVLGILFPVGLFIVCTAISTTDVGLGLVRWLQNNPL